MEVMRSLFLFLSRNRYLKHWASQSPLAQIAARRFVAGETVDHAIRAIRDATQRGLTTTFDHLGENTETEAQAIAAADDYVTALSRMAGAGIQTHVSVKLTQLGLDLGTAFCQGNVARVAARAKEIGTCMRIDMESSDYIDRTFEVLLWLRRKFDNVGIVIQAYLYRSQHDVEEMIQAGIPVRLCKGAYNEPSSVAFPKKTAVDQNMIDLMQLLLSEKALKSGARLAMATHDEKLIEATKAFAAAHKVPQESYEFQMLYGVRPGLQQRLADEGYGMRIYVPYGREWYPYYMRRLAERPANVWFILSNLFRN
jgi:proline dehydrogenase